MTHEHASIDHRERDRRLRADSSIVGRVNQSSVVGFHRNEIVYSQGDHAALVFYVRTGTLKVTTASEDGRGAVGGLHLPGDFFGEECVAGHKSRVATVTALTECNLVQMPKTSIARALANDPEFSGLFRRYLLERGSQMQADLVDQLLNSTEKRLARLLLILAKHGTEGRLESILPNINQEMLAEMIGSSRSNVNLFMNKFRRLGFIEYGADLKVNRSLSEVMLPKRSKIGRR